ncbi:MAG: GMC family oxidoreductase [Pseudomonadota bacterium]|nr:GMC family oxidoreductase [Pseudomonadota bacterium]
MNIILVYQRGSMKIDGRKIGEGSVLESDVCIVGAGAAGITLSLSLIRAGINVILIESGGLTYDPNTQDLYAGENIGRSSEATQSSPLSSCRLRYFGGTTNHWVGNCPQLSEIDFEQKPWSPGTGWPIPFEEVQAYYNEAADICQLGPDFNLLQKSEISKTPRPFPITGNRLRNYIHRVVSPTKSRFGMIYGETLFSSDRVRVVLNANAVELVPTTNAKQIKHIRIKTLDGNQFHVLARHFVIATGGIENARLLLASRSVISNGLGNDFDWVGRTFMEHAHLVSGFFLPTNSNLKGNYYKRFKIENSDNYYRGMMMPRPEQIRADQILNSSIHLVPVERIPERYIEAELSEAFASLRSLRRSAIRGEFPDDFWEYMWNILTDIDDAAIGTYSKSQKPSEPGNMYKLFVISETAPNRNSRVQLTDKVDALGMPRVSLNWQLSPIDFKTTRRMQELVGLEMGRADLGRVFLPNIEYDDVWNDLIFGGCHHMGTTRMDPNPKLGVVDKDARVHGIANLWLAGSSIFPSVGAANPTLTIVALTLRLGNRLRTEFN